MTKIAIEKIFPNPEQPRVVFDPLELEALARSITEHGLINPVAVEGPHENGIYILIDGERRVRASKMAGLEEVEASVRPPMNGNGPRERLSMAMVANLQRADMDNIETAKGYRKLRELGYSVVEIADMTGMSAGMIHTHLGLLNLDPEIQDLFAQKRLPVSSQVTAALRSLPDEKRVGTARSLANKKATIRVILSICERMANYAHAVDRPIERGNNPMVAIAKKYHTYQGGHWNMISQAKTFMLDEKLRLAAEDTCHSCALYDVASENNCRDCPAVVLLRKLTAES